MTTADVLVVLSVIVTVAHGKDPAVSDIKTAMAKEAQRVIGRSEGKPLTFSCGFREADAVNLATVTVASANPGGTLLPIGVVQQLPGSFGCSKTVEMFKKCMGIAQAVADGLGLCKIGSKCDACAFDALLGTFKSDACKIETSVRKAIVKLAQSKLFPAAGKVKTVEVFCRDNKFDSFRGTDAGSQVVEQITVPNICGESAASRLATNMDPNWTPHKNALYRIASARNFCDDKPNLNALENFQKLFA